MKGKLNFVAGLFLGICLVTGTGAAAAVVETVTATLNRSPIYVDGSRVDLAGYTINGYNYFKLRDIAALWTLVSNGIRRPRPSRSTPPMATRVKAAKLHRYPSKLQFAMFPPLETGSLARTVTSTKLRMSPSSITVCLPQRTQPSCPRPLVIGACCRIPNCRLRKRVTLPPAAASTFHAKPL